MFRAENVAADVAAGASAVLAAATWVAQLNEWLQLGATIVAIAAGVMAVLWHYEKWRSARTARKEHENGPL